LFNSSQDPTGNIAQLHHSQRQSVVLQGNPPTSPASFATAQLASLFLLFIPRVLDGFGSMPIEGVIPSRVGQAVPFYRGKNGVGNSLCHNSLSLSPDDAMHP
jgi:hypothetical protein